MFTRRAFSIISIASGTHRGCRSQPLRHPGGGRGPRDRADRRRSGVTAAFVQLRIAAAVDRRRGLRRRDRAVLVQRGDREPLLRRGRVLLRQPTPAAHRRNHSGGQQAHTAGELQPARTVVLGLLLPHEHRPHARLTAGVCGHRQRRRAGDPPVRHRRCAGECGRHRSRVGESLPTTRPTRRSPARVATGAGAWTLGLRVPSWCEGAAVAVNGQMADAVTAGGKLLLSRIWAAGDVVTLSLPIPARFTWPDPRIDAVRGQVAVERGPLVHCLESADLGADVEEAVLDVAAGLQVVDGDVLAAISRRSVEEAPWAYSPTPAAGTHTRRGTPCASAAVSRVGEPGCGDDAGVRADGLIRLLSTGQRARTMANWVAIGPGRDSRSAHDSPRSALRTTLSGFHQCGLHRIYRIGSGCPDLQWSRFSHRQATSPR